MGSLLIPTDVRVESEFKLLPLTEPGSGTEVSPDGKTVCYWNGARIHCQRVPSYSPAGAWHLGRSSPCSWSVRAARFFTLDGSQHLLVAMESRESGESHLLVLQCGRAAPLKRIRLPYRAASLAILSMPDSPQPISVAGPLLGAFAGCAAIGCHAGHVMLVDLRLDDDNNNRDISSFGAGDGSGNPNDSGANLASTGVEAAALAMPMSTLAGVAAAASPADAVARLRDAACDSGGHLYCLLDDHVVSGANFKYKKTNGEVWSAFASDSVTVTALHYARLTASLLVGFSFGGAQIWRLVDGFHEFTCKIDLSSPPVSHFVLLKADDDPMNLLYLWICRGSRDVSLPSNIVLYQLKYRTRQSRSGSQSPTSESESAATAAAATAARSSSSSSLSAGYHYTDLVSAGVSFSQPLAMSGGEATGSRLIHCDSLITRRCSSSSGNIGNASGEDELGRAYFVWTECSNSILHVGVFDLNRWYQCQLPRNAKYNLRTLHPYFAVHRFELQHYLLSSGLRVLGGPVPTVLAACVVPDSVSQFRAGLNPRPGAPSAEQLYYPAALTYRLRLHCPPHTLLLRCDGAQRAHLDLIGRLAPDSLMSRANELADRCVQLGLLSPPLTQSQPQPEPSSPAGASTGAVAEEACTDGGDNDPDARRRILTVCLEHGRDDALVSLGCGQYASLVIDWLWASVRRYKRLLDASTVALFRTDEDEQIGDNGNDESVEGDASVLIEDVDAEAVASDSRVVQLVALLDRLDSLFRRLLDCRPMPTASSATSATSAALADLRFRADAVARLCAYARRLQWCARVRLLPPSRLAPVFAELSRRIDDARRSRCLVVDCLVDRLFNRDDRGGDVGACAFNLDAGSDDRMSPGSITYPPADARHLLESTFLRAPPGCDPRLQHCLVAYLLMDLQALLEDADDAEELTEQWDGYLSVSGQPASLARWANLLWSLDHSLWSEAMSLLDDPDLSRPLFPGLADGLVSAVAEAAPDVAARCLIRFRPHSQVSPALALRVLLASGRPDLALDLVVRPTGDTLQRDELLDRLLDECAASKKWRGRLFAGINWRLEELPRVTDFAAKSGCQQIKEQLVAHLLLTGRYAEAVQLSDRLPVRDAASAARKRLVDIVLDSLPRVQRDLLRLEIAQAAAGGLGALATAFPTRRTVDPRQLSAQPSVTVFGLSGNPFGTSVTTEKLYANVVATREKERQAWLKAVQSDRPNFFRGLLSNVFMTPSASAASAYAATISSRPACSLSTIKKRIGSPVLTNPRSAKVARRDAVIFDDYAAAAATAATAQLGLAASPRIRGQCDQLLRTPCRLLNSQRKQPQQLGGQQQQQQQQSVSRRFHFSSTLKTGAGAAAPPSHPVVSILRKSAAAAAGGQSTRSHSPAGRLRFADDIVGNDAATEKRQELEKEDIDDRNRPVLASVARTGRLLFRRPGTPGPPPKSFDMSIPDQPAPIPIDLDENSFDSPTKELTEQQQQQASQKAANIGDHQAELATSSCADVEMAEASENLSAQSISSDEDSGATSKKPSRPLAFAELPAAAPNFAATAERATPTVGAAASPASSSEVFVTPEETSPDVESPPLPVTAPVFSPGAAVASPVASMARRDLIEQSPTGDELPLFTFSKPLANLRLINAAQADFEATVNAGFAFSPPSVPGVSARVPLLLPSRRMSPPLQQQPSRQMSPPLQSPTRQMSPPLQSPTRQMSPPLQSPTRQMSPPLQSPTRQMSPPLQSPTRQMSPPLQSPTQRMSPAHQLSPQHASPSIISVVVVRRPAGSPIVVHSARSADTEASSDASEGANAGQRTIVQEVSMDISAANVDGDALEQRNQSEVETQENSGEPTEEAEAPASAADALASASAETKDDGINFEADSFFAKEPDSVAVSESTKPHTSQQQEEVTTPPSRQRGRRRLHQLSRTIDDEEAVKDSVEKENETIASSQEEVEGGSVEAASTPPTARSGVDHRRRSRRRQDSESSMEADADSERANNSEEESEAKSDSPKIRYPTRRRVSMSAPPTPTPAPGPLQAKQQQLRRSSRRASIQSLADDSESAMPPPPPPTSFSVSQSTSASTMVGAASAAVAAEDDPLNTSASSMDSELSSVSAPAGPVRRSNRLRVGRRQQPPRLARSRRASDASAVDDDLPALPEEAASQFSPGSSAAAPHDATAAARGGRRRRGRLATARPSSEAGFGSPDSATSEASSCLSIRTDTDQQRRRGVGRRGARGRTVDAGPTMAAETPTAGGRRTGLRSRDK